MGSGGAQDYSQIIYRHSVSKSEQWYNAASCTNDSVSARIFTTQRQQWQQLTTNGRDWNSSRPMAEIRTAHRQWARLEQLTVNGRDTKSSPSMGKIRTAHDQWRRYEQLTANGRDTNSSPSMGEIGTAHGQWERYEQLPVNGRDTNSSRPMAGIRTARFPVISRLVISRSQSNKPLHPKP